MLNQKRRMLKEQIEKLQQEVQNGLLDREVINNLERLLEEYEGHSKHSKEEDEEP